jgi:hypothetical protein
MFIFLVFHKSGLIKSCLSSKVYLYTKFHGPALTGESFASASEVWMSILEWMKLRD